MGHVESKQLIRGLIPQKIQMCSNVCKILLCTSLKILILSLMVPGTHSVLANTTEFIPSFLVEYDIKSDGTVQVIETITYNFGQNNRHDIV